MDNLNEEIIVKNIQFLSSVTYSISLPEEDREVEFGELCEYLSKYSDFGEMAVLQFNS
jgi:hypothetical protein